MKKVRLWKYLLVLLTAAFVLAIDISAQDLNPIRWAVKQEDPGSAVKAGVKFNIRVIATIDEGWHLYSLEQPAGGPIPTRIGLPEKQNFKLAGDIESPLPRVLFDPNFNMDTEFYEGEAVFILPVEIAKDAPTGRNTLSVNAFFQTCNDKTCLPPKNVGLTANIDVAGETRMAGNSPANSNLQSPKPHAAVGKPLTSNAKAVDFDFVDFTGKTRKFSEFRGKFVLLDFWATWCAPCLADIPKLKKLYEKYNANGFEIIGMDSETIGDEAEAPDPEFAKETHERAKQIVTTRRITWTQATSETAVPVAMKVFGVISLPTKILIDKEGKVIATIGEKDDLTGIVEKLLGEKK